MRLVWDAAETETSGWRRQSGRGQRETHPDPGENKRDLANTPDAVLTATQWQFYKAPTKAALTALGIASIAVRTRLLNAILPTLIPPGATRCTTGYPDR
jgi:hypothetical protein